jgi:CRP-like cAMP-binding protein
MPWTQFLIGPSEPKSKGYGRLAHLRATVRATDRDDHEKRHLVAVGFADAENLSWQRRVACDRRARQRLVNLTSANGYPNPCTRRSMSAATQARRQPGNLLLDTLSDDEYQRQAPRLQSIHLRSKDLLGERGASLGYVYFPCSCVCSALAFMSDGAAVEVGAVGREGFVGIESLAGGEQWLGTTLCQVEGECLRMSIGDFKEAVAGDTPLRRAAQRFLLAYLVQLSKSVACNRLHTIEARFCRWLLMTHDRVGKDEFHLTQEFLAVMLGVKRPSVSVMASAFQQSGLIRYNRGNMAILDRPGLENRCCECYVRIQASLSDCLAQSACEAKRIPPYNNRFRWHR